VPYPRDDQAGDRSLLGQDYYCKDTSNWTFSQIRNWFRSMLIIRAAVNVPFLYNLGEIAPFVVESSGAIPRHLQA